MAPPHPFCCEEPVLLTFIEKTILSQLCVPNTFVKNLLASRSMALFQDSAPHSTDHIFVFMPTMCCPTNHSFAVSLETGQCNAFRSPL